MRAFARALTNVTAQSRGRNWSATLSPIIPLNNMIESKNSVEILDHYTANETLAGHAESEFSVVYFDAKSRPHLLWDGPSHAGALSQAGVFAGRLRVSFVVDRCQRAQATANKDTAR
jgi:hypothetical protein